MYFFKKKKRILPRGLSNGLGLALGGGFLGSAECRINTASPNNLELSSVRFACWHPYITHLKDEDCFFYLYKNLSKVSEQQRLDLFI